MRTRAGIATGLAAFGLALALWTGGATPAAAQEARPAPAQSEAPRQIVRSPILTLESERLFVDSALGQRLIAEIEAAGQALSAENRRIETELTEEERRLTALRAETAPAEFRDLADAFDDRVQALRQSQDAKARELANRGDRVRRDFFNAVQPVLTEILREAGAALIIERANVLLSANAIDITDLAIARVDARIGDGADVMPGEGAGAEDPEAAPDAAVPDAGDGADGSPLFDMGDPQAGTDDRP
ncbi:periplasmic chaperone for outer membrane proteins Skp [Roseivivax lentus]|uniref:Periplasmic chaperone for outer membrane proteins Skp n=1 Tax=Roseivivax lentus TaxID=633194 RepID=A0A1N7LYJ1_9RHOB|nr:OmpH family outer membrane protein [Roseivivax lentus]SIS78915.1 periplasmic chaperone for outer membrane proteins Skp [Roseivivax lentus]